MRASLTAISVAMLAMATTGFASSMSDPTRPMNFVQAAPSGAPAKPTGPILQSTLVSPGRKSAIISGRQVKVGDTVDGAVVTDISAFEVRLRRGERETSLRLFPKMTKEAGTVE